MDSEQRLVVVSNRLPVTIRRSGEEWRVQASSGGLVTAMDPILRRNDGIWIGWPGDPSGGGDPSRQEAIDRAAGGRRFIVVDLPERVVELFYEGYSNQAIWPVFHYFPAFFSYDPEAWRAYIEANRMFHDVVVENARAGDLIWVHDYQLMLLPAMLRQSLPDARIGFFLHIPFPSSEVFRLLPGREDLLQGLLGADLIAFHTHAHLQHFRSALLRVGGVESRMNAVESAGRTIRLEALPIGIAPEEFRGMLEGNAQTRHFLSEYEERFRGRRIIVSVDRLDYTKGIPLRLRTFRRLLERNADLRGRVTLIQVAVPSREKAPFYAQLRRQVNELVGEINGEYAAPDWTPVVHLNRGISRAQLVALYAVADIGWVNPLRDGMNLVAKEYVASNRGGGVLVLSELTGAAEEMGEALLVNPFDEERTAEAIERALDMPVEERRDRMEALRRRVERNNAFAWSERFIELVGEAAAERARRVEELPGQASPEAIAASYRAARERVLCFSYEGTLAPAGASRRQSAPPPGLEKTIARLAADPANLVALISVRGRADLEQWFGGIPGLWMAAEHGALIRPGGALEWRAAHPNLSTEWKAPVMSVLEQFADRAPGSVIDEREYSVAWHYRLSDPQFGDWLAGELAGFLERMLSETQVSAVRGHKCVEIRPLWIQKAQFVEQLLEERPGADFRFALGSDRADEDVFGRMGPRAWTVRVGRAPSSARFWTPSPDDAVELLRRMAGSG
ncbi:MAG: bifunctional alpha,alpha-trehalose-phosphate synthase (UDP-forming)/trehalose-phosphatase [Bryobacteraceae bacterium]|nr:bifunctional alpha,alpha-trehalose-phosphate synthase (UDP-forming)/trehalose-phosphatase [Bryobacteraceae bacterium]